MSNAWDDMKRAKEEEYFSRQNQEALKKLRAGLPAHHSPITGEPLTQINIDGASALKCEKSGGVWIELKDIASIKDPASLGAWLLKVLN